MKKLPEVEIQLFSKGTQICIFRSKLSGWGRDRLDVQDILDVHNLKSLYNFNPVTRNREDIIRFSSIDGKSFGKYTDETVIFVDGDPKEDLTAGRVAAAAAAVMVGIASAVVIGVVLVQFSKWIWTWRLDSGKIPPWIIAFLVIVFTVVRNRGKNRAGVPGERNKQHIL